MLKNEFDFYSKHLISAQYKNEIELSIAFLKEDRDVFKALEEAGYPLGSVTQECIAGLRELSPSDVATILVKAYWLIDTFQVNDGLNLNHLDHDSNGLSDIAFGQHFFSCINYFDLSPLEELQVTWSHIFSVVALDRLAQLYFYSVKATELAMQQKLSTLKLLYIDLIDCSSKSQTFELLLDDGWVKSYYAKHRGMAKITKLNQLKKIVLIRCIKEHSDVDPLSAANAIECQLVEENCPELSLLKSEKRRAKTFAEWISDLRNGVLKVPV